jgi:hypothetical protein
MILVHFIFDTFELVIGWLFDSWDTVVRILEDFIPA